MRAVFAAKTIDVGDYPHWHLFGLTFDANVVVSSLVAMLIVVILGVVLRRVVTDGVPGKFQVLWEMVTVELVGALAESAIPKNYKKFVPVGVTIFVYLLVCNLMSLIPTSLRPGQTYDILPPPASDINLPLALAAFVIIWMHVESVRARRPGGYIRHYFQPHWLFSPINAIEEIVKPVTLTLRLFGNLFCGVILLSLIQVLIPVWGFWPLEFIWKAFDGLFIGPLQAYIFMLLSILYFGMGMETVDHEHEPALPSLAPRSQVAQ